MSFFPRFWKWLQFEDNGLLWKSLFPFFLSKNASFQHSCVKVVKAKKCKPLEMRPRVTCAREKRFFSSKIWRSSWVLHREETPLDFCILFCSILAPKWDDSLQLSEEDGTPIKILWFRPVSLRRNWVVGLYCRVWFAKWVVSIGKTSLFRRFFTLCPHFHPYICEGVKEESCTLRESAVEYLCEEHEWVPKIG